MENRNIGDIYLDSARRRFRSYRELAEGAIAQLDDLQLRYQPDASSNSISVIMAHMSGNLVSRFTDFLGSDGEKPWRQRDAEFEETVRSRKTLLSTWDQAWSCLFKALSELKETDLGRNVLIRQEAHSVIDALNRQLTHQAYHVGQIVYIAKLIKGTDWKNLSIPKAPKA
jgi:uncharacterized damage-inducible protein DinB